MQKIDGYVILRRPYSFNNSLSDNLGLSLEDDQFFCFVDAGMASQKTIDKFLKKVSRSVGREMSFGEVYY